MEKDIYIIQKPVKIQKINKGDIIIVDEEITTKNLYNIDDITNS